MENSNELSATHLQSNLNESQIVFAEEVLSHSLFQNENEVQESGESAERGIVYGRLNFVAGIARFNLRGHRWYTFSFDIPCNVVPRSAVVSLGLMNIYNNSRAVDLQYRVSSYSLSYVGRNVRVTGRIFIGDSDGYLFGLSYNCVAYF